MIEIVVLSGKGGTGKTSLTAAFAHVAGGAVLCDLDVDAPDLHLLLQPRRINTTAFVSGHHAVIRTEECQGCGTCAEMCRFGAVIGEGRQVRIDPLRCEGCKVCVAFCPAGAIDFPDKTCGEWFLSCTRFGTMVHAQLFPAEENSGRLVALLRQQARAQAQEQGADLILSDGPPGIGCPVISSLSGASFAVLVTEPTPSGRHDLERIVELCAHFQVPAGVIINKSDLSSDRAGEIRNVIQRHNLMLLGDLPHDPAFTQAMIRGLAVTEHAPSAAAAALHAIWATIAERVLAPGLAVGQ
jgi:MinD superfamily P-loop ATPase